MARPSDDLATAWSSLASADESTTGWRSIAVSRPGAITLHAGRRHPGGEEALLARFSAATVPAGQKLPDGHGFHVQRADLSDAGTVWLALTRSAAGSVELFAAMASDVAEALDACAEAEEALALRVMLGRVRAWQEFMRKGAQALSAESEIGLIGELAALVAMIQSGLSPVVATESWVGPLDGLRDFEIGVGGMEVKTTVAAHGFRARIGSLEQLDDTARQPLFLAGIRLREATDGRSLPDAVAVAREAVKGDPEARRLMDERLLAAGYLDAHADTYSRRFATQGTRILHVCEGFPRLTPWNVPAGVTGASYEIDFENAPGASLGFDEALRKLGAL